MEDDWWWWKGEERWEGEGGALRALRDGLVGVVEREVEVGVDLGWVELGAGGELIGGMGIAAFAKIWRC